MSIETIFLLSGAFVLCWYGYYKYCARIRGRAREREAARRLLAEFDAWKASQE